MFDLTWPTAHTRALVVTFVAAAAYVAYHYGAHADRWRRGAATTDAEEARAVHRQRLGGALLLGVLPAGVAFAWPDGAWGLSLPRPAVAGGFVAAVVVIILPIIAMSARGPAFRDDYPQMRLAAPWTRAQRLRNAASWTIYLLAYEFFFRGFVLFTLAEAFGAWPAIALSTLAYAWAHLPKNAAETIGTLPMGVIFAVVALEGGGIWGPFVAHVIIANWSDYLASRPTR